MLHYASSKSKIVCKSVLFAELFALVEGYDVGYTINHTYRDFIGRKIYLTLHTDNRSLYRLSISLAHTTERRLQIDLAVIWQAYVRRDNTGII